uniref:Synaptonemal complex protein 3 n=1 Tax=Neolamprologus brichardi TaxID=32507 RepID=A0A3Q4GUM2_NEOBR
MILLNQHSLMLCGCIVEHTHHVFTEVCMRLFQVWRSALLAGQSEDRNLILQSVSVITYLFVLPADISKVMQAKKKRLECLTKNYMKGSQHKLEQLWNNYHSQRQKMTQQYSQQVSSALQQWETEAQRAEEQEEKLNNLFRQQQKVLQQARVVQNQKLKTVRELYEQFVKVNLVEVGGCFCEQKPVYEETHQLESSDKLSVMFLLFLLQLQWSRSSSATMMKPPCVHYRWMKTRRWPAACR